MSQKTGILYFDGIASVIIGLILEGTAIWLAYETKGLLIGESANTRIVEGIRALVQGSHGVEQLNEVLTIHLGPDFILVNRSVDFHDAVTAGDMESLIAGPDAAIKQQFPAVKRVFIEAEARKIQQRKIPVDLM